MHQKKRGRPRIGQPISIVLYPHQEEWVREKAPPGDIARLIRELIDEAMKHERETNELVG